MERSQFVGADGKKKFPEIPPRAATNDPEAAGRGGAGDPGICVPYYGSAGSGNHPRPPLPGRLWGIFHDLVKIDESLIILLLCSAGASHRMSHSG